MKRILLRFENNNGTILTCAIISIVMGLVAGIAFSDCEIVGGCVFAALCTGAIATLLYNVLRKEVIIDFKHNRVKMKAGTKKEQCQLDNVKDMEIIFHQVKKMKCYSAQVIANLKDGRTISIKIYPKSHRYRAVTFFYGRVTNRFKARIEKQVKAYDLITCHTEN